MERQGARALLLPLVVALSGPACDFQKDPDPGPVALSPTRFVTIKVEYRQPAGCQNNQNTCDARVVFFGSWMRPSDASNPGDQVLLDTRFGPNFWEGVVANVPVNWPPSDFPHYVRVYDPHLQATASGGVTAARLSVGGQIITTYDTPGTPTESGLIYIDDNGVGRNPE
jgi:hypothetical protein